MMQRKIMIAAMMGNIMESFDFYLYALLSPILAKLFFPSTDPMISMLMFLMTYAIGFFARPIGALFFGHWGDRFGRKNALALAIILMAAPTAMMAVLPTYDSIGFWAPAILVFCRLIQGFSVGGEQIGAAIFAVEHAQNKRLGFVSSLIISAGFIGAVLASGFCSFITQEGMPPWVWRIPFLIGALIGVVGFYLRSQVKETPDFEKAEKLHILSKSPFLEAMRKDLRSVLCIIGLGLSIGVIFYIPMAYTSIYLTTIIHKPLSSALTINTIGLFFLMGTLPLFGILSDRWGHHRWMIMFSWMVFLLAYPIFILLSKGETFSILIAQILMMILCAGFTAPSNAVMSSLFPVQDRYSGIAFSYSVGIAIAGGLAPLAATYLVSATGDVRSPAYLLMVMALVGLVSVIQAKKHEGSVQSFD